MTIFSVTLFSCQSCHSVCSVWGARGWQLRHHHHLCFTEQETKARAREWAALFCTWWSQNLSRDLLNPILHLFLSLKKHLHSNSIDHDTAVKILYWSVVKLKSPRIFPLTRIWTADSLIAGIMAQRQTNHSWVQLWQCTQSWKSEFPSLGFGLLVCKSRELDYKSGETARSFISSEMYDSLHYFSSLKQLSLWKTVMPKKRYLIKPRHLLHPLTGSLLGVMR